MSLAGGGLSVTPNPPKQCCSRPVNVPPTYCSQKWFAKNFKNKKGYCCKCNKKIPAPITW